MHWIDPDSLPEVAGIFERFVLNPHGEVDGFVMKDRHTDVLVHAKGRQMIDEGPDHDREHPKVKHEPMRADGTVQLSLFGPKGELRGALLSDGTVLRVGPKEAERVAALLAPGAKLAARGDGVQTRYGRVIHAFELGPDPARLKSVRKPKPKKPKHEHDARTA